MLPPNSRGSTELQGPVRPRRHRQNSEERSQRNPRPPQRTDHRLPVDRDDAAAKLRIVFRQRAAQREDQIPAPVDGQRHVLDTHLEGIAWLGAAYGDGPGQDVQTRRGLELLAYLAMVRQAHVGKSTGHGFDRQRVAGLNGEAWGDFCVEVAPVHGGRVGERACDESACLPLALHGWSPVARLAARFYFIGTPTTEMLIEHSRLLCQPCGRALENESTGREHINIIRYRQS